MEEEAKAIQDALLRHHHNPLAPLDEHGPGAYLAGVRASTKFCDRVGTMMTAYTEHIRETCTYDEYLAHTSAGVEVSQPKS